MTTNRTWREIIGIVALATFLGGSGLPRAAGPALPGPPDGPNSPLTLTSVANMGVLASSGETKVLIDALFDKPNPDYRAPAPGLLEAIFKGEPPFDGVDLVLVTHNHPDHFDASLGVRYLETFAGATLVAPVDAVEAMRRAAADWAKIGPRVVPIDLKVGDADGRDLKGIPVTACRTLHSGDLESPMNLMYLVNLAGRRLWHEGDTNGRPEVFRAFGLGQDPIDLAIVHYWFPLEPNCSRFLQEVLDVDHIALGHLPIRLEDDAPSKIDQVRRYYKDIFLLLPGMPAKAAAAGTAAQRSPERGLAPGQAIVEYLFHSGWAVQTQNHLLIFDYTEPLPPPGRPALAPKSIEPAEIADQDVTVFVSHVHSDHFNPEILKWRSVIENVRYVWGWEDVGAPEDIHFGRERRVVEDRGLEILNIYHEGDGIPESSFLVRVDGLAIFHAGDHGSSRGMKDPVFGDNIRYLAGQAPKLDLMFTPTFGGEIDAIRALQPRVVFPMHDGGRERQYALFARKLESIGLKVQVGAAAQRGARFFYSEGSITVR